MVVEKGADLELLPEASRRVAKKLREPSSPKSPMELARAVRFDRIAAETLDAVAAGAAAPRTHGRNCRLPLRHSAPPRPVRFDGIIVETLDAVAAALPLHLGWGEPSPRAPVIIVPPLRTGGGATSQLDTPLGALRPATKPWELGVRYGCLAMISV